MNSVFLWLNKHDWIKGLIVATLTGSFTVVKHFFDVFNSSGVIPSLDWNTVLWSGVAGGVAYLSKNLFSNSEGKFLTPESKE